MMQFRYISPTSATTRKFAAKFATRRPGQLIFHIHGELGVGKTTFVQGLFTACGVRETINSPSYALACQYEADGKKYLHLDFYRCTNPAEWLGAALDEDLGQASVTAIEWPEKAQFLPAADLEVKMRDETEQEKREILVSAATAAGRKVLRGLNESAKNV